MGLPPALGSELSGRIREQIPKSGRAPTSQGCQSPRRWSWEPRPGLCWATRRTLVTGRFQGFFNWLLIEVGRGRLGSMIRSDTLVRCKLRHMGCLPLWILHVSVVFSLCSVTDQESYGHADSFRDLFADFAHGSLCFIHGRGALLGLPKSNLSCISSVKSAVRPEVATLDVLYTSCRNPCLCTAKSKSLVMRRKSSRSFRAGMDPRPPLCRH